MRIIKLLIILTKYKSTSQSENGPADMHARRDRHFENITPAPAIIADVGITNC